jgi:hypothetical protein
MVVELDIWRAGWLLLRQHGYDAPLVAAQRRDKHMEHGDVDGIIVWKRIISAIEEPTRIRGDGECLN